MSKIFYSIIIPYIEYNEYLDINIKKFDNNNLNNFEILLLPNKRSETDLRISHLKNKNKFKVIETSISNPSYKRNLGASKSIGEYLIFIDDDAYPEKNWLEEIDKEIKNNYLKVFGGPSLLPIEQKEFIPFISDFFYRSWYGGGNTLRYKSIDIIAEVDDWPSVNLIIEKKLFFDIGKYDEKLYPGEDTDLCLKLKKKGYLIKYNSKVIVRHFRRNSIKKHLIQLFKYGYYRSYIILKYGVNLNNIKAFIPMFFTISILVSFFKVFPNNYLVNLTLLYLVPITFLNFFKIQKIKNKLMSPIISIFFLISHISYGLGSIIFFLKKFFDLKFGKIIKK